MLLKDKSEDFRGSRGVQTAERLVDQMRKKKLVESFKDRQEKALHKVQERTKEHGIAIVRAEASIVIAPVRDGAVLDPSHFARLPAKTRAEIQAEMERVGAELERLFQRFHEWAHDQHDEIAAVESELKPSTLIGDHAESRAEMLEPHWACE